MRQWLSIFSASGLSLAAASRGNLALWPQLLDAKLLFSTSIENVTVIEASNGGVLSTFSTKIDMQSKVSFDPLIDSIQITWIPATELQSSTFDRFFASSLRFDRINAVGIHLRAELRKEVENTAIDETTLERLEVNVRDFLHDTLPSFKIYPWLSKGFFAKSFCDVNVWKTVNLPVDISHGSTISSRTCLSSSFPLMREEGTPSFYSKFIQEVRYGGTIRGDSSFEQSLIEAHRNFLSSRHELKLSFVKFSHGSTIEAEYLGAYIMKPLSADKAFEAANPVCKSTSDVLVVTSIAKATELYELKQAWLQFDGKIVPLNSVVEVQILKFALATTMQSAIVGAGFHRQYVIDLEIFDLEVSDQKDLQNSIFVRMPISNTAYIDLDEIRRMERFGDLKLISFTKHIEIERPSTVSSHHIIGFEFLLSTANKLHFKIPIHFRYQAASKSSMYRSASVIAPDCFLISQGVISAKTKVKISRDDRVLKYFQTWDLIDKATTRSDSQWSPLIAKHPLPVSEVLIPVGYLPLSWLVSTVTLIFAFMGAAILIWLSIGNANRAQSAKTNFGARWKRKLRG
ncbi:putative glycosylphosphatidylinositol-mannosyltransferase I, PIG-X/PBN1 [Plasmopara halstedii]